MPYDEKELKLGFICYKPLVMIVGPTLFFEDRHVVDCATYFGEEFLGNIQKFHIVVSTLLFKRMQSGIKLKTNLRKPKFILRGFFLINEVFSSSPHYIHNLTHMHTCIVHRI